MTRSAYRTSSSAALLFSLLVLPLVNAAEIRSPKLAALAVAVDGDPAAEDRFWSELNNSQVPLVESGTTAETILVSFLWHAEPEQSQSNIAISGAFLVPRQKTIERLEQIGKSSVWYRTYELPRAARFSYYLVAPQGRTPAPDANWRDEIDGITQEFFADPLSAQRFVDSSSGQAVSYFVGPDAPKDRYSIARATVQSGKTETFEIESNILSNRRTISVYTPSGYSPRKKPYGMVLLFDRESYLAAIPTPTILDNMIADGVIPPVIAVLVSPIDDETRGRELPPNEKFQQFIGDELMPWVKARYAVSDDPRRSVVAGSSYGGLAASHTAFSHAKVFGNVISQSGSYWWGPGRNEDDPNIELLWEGSGWVAKQYGAAAKLPIRFYMDVGVWEGTDMILPNRQLRTVLEAKKYPVTYREVIGGHDYFNWRITLSDGLIATIGNH